MTDRLFDVRTLAAGELHIPNWASFQHYKDRNPPWIKTYTELLSDEAYLQLTGHRRAILHGLWLEYARSNCRLSLDTRTLTRRLGLKVSSADLEALHDSGFIQTAPPNHAGLPGVRASTPLAERLQPASTPLASRAPAHSREGEAEKNLKPKAVTEQGANGAVENRTADDPEPSLQ